MSSKDNKVNKVKTFKKEFIFTAIALIAVGAMFVILPKSSTKIICYVTAGLLCVWGIIKLFMYISAERQQQAFTSFSLVGSVALIIGGVAIFINPEFFAGILATFFGCVMIVDGVLKVQYGVDLAKIGAKMWWTILILAAVIIGLGLVVVFNPFSTAMVFTIFAGAVLIINGISDIVTIIYVSHIYKELAKKQKTITLTDEDYKDVD